MISSAGWRMVRMVGVAVFICFGVYLFLIRPIWGKKLDLLEKKLEEKHALIKKYISREGGPPTEETYNLLVKQKESLEGSSTSLSELIDAPTPHLPEGIVEPRLYFKERLYGAKKRLDAMAGERGIELPLNLGFSEELPESQMVSLLLRRLETLDNLVAVLIEKGATSIELIRPLSPKEMLDPQTNQLLYREMPFQLKVECPTEALVDFLYETRKASPILVVKELKVKSGRGDTLDVELLISEVIVEQEDEAHD